MKVVSFNLSSKFAHFKKPDVNSNVYFTYSHIHKVVLLGVFGAILRLDGYNQNIKDKSKIKSLKQAMFGKKYFYKEYLPVGMKEKFLMYDMQNLVLSSGIIESDEIWEYEGKGVWCD